MYFICIIVKHIVEDYTLIKKTEIDDNSVKLEKFTKKAQLAQDALKTLNQKNSDL